MHKIKKCNTCKRKIFGAIWIKGKFYCGVCAKRYNHIGFTDEKGRRIEYKGCIVFGP
jgi:hypothetical protein